MELLHEPRTARKVLLLQDSQSEVLVLTSRHLMETWTRELRDALKSCAQRGLTVKLLIEGQSFSQSTLVTELQGSGVKARSSTKKFSWIFRTLPVQGEMWIFDRQELIAVNERIQTAASARDSAMAVECLMGSEVAYGTASYFDQRWDSAAATPLAYSVRQKNYAFHSGHQAEQEFFACIQAAHREITLSLPGGRISRAVSQALHFALSDGLMVTIFTNAERDDAPALRRLRRLAAAGAVVKICGQRLSSECAVVDGSSVYMGSLPATWNLWSKGACPVFVMQDGQISQEILAALENQVSIEINGEPVSQFYAFR